jgi:flavin reductase (DIM6/NTAB) family NADH-FMN oxidoreductase RutF
MTEPLSTSRVHAVPGRALRDAIGPIATGVTIVTARHPDGEDFGTTASAASSVSLDPPLVLVVLAVYLDRLTSALATPRGERRRGWGAAHRPAAVGEPEAVPVA